MKAITRHSANNLNNLYHSIQAESSSMNERNDCAVVAISIVTGVPYKEVHVALKDAGRKNREGTYQHESKRAIEALGFKARSWSFMEYQRMINSYPANHSQLHNITSHHPNRFPKQWAGKTNLLLFSRHHVLALMDGKVQDWSVRNSLRIVYIWEITKA